MGQCYKLFISGLSFLFLYIPDGFFKITLKNKTYLKLIVFIPSQSNDVHLTVVENPAALENISGKYYVINVTIL